MDGGQEAECDTWVLTWATGWVMSSINHKPLMAAPKALFLGDLNHGWLRVARDMQGPYSEGSGPVDPGLNLSAALWKDGLRDPGGGSTSTSDVLLLSFHVGSGNTGGEPR